MAEPNKHLQQPAAARDNMVKARREFASALAERSGKKDFARPLTLETVGADVRAFYL